MTTLQRYLLFQVPGWTLGAVLLFGFREWIGLPLWGSVLVYSLYVVKDFALYPFLRVAYQTGTRTGIERLVGEKAIVKTPLRPEGYVRVRGELWRARLAVGDAEAPPGTRVRVDSARGMVLTVSVEDQGGAEAR